MQQPKRIKERYVWEAIELVQKWRSLYENSGQVDEHGNLIKFTLNQAADVVGVPKKTLEDYYYLLRNASKISTFIIQFFFFFKVNLQEKRNEKMGYIRKICKENKPQKVQIEKMENFQEEYQQDE